MSIFKHCGSVKWGREDRVGELLREPIYTLDGDDFKQMVLAALLWLRQHQAMVNALNVFPVPDGDTGTNMTLTMTSAWDEIAGVQEDTAREAMRLAAHKLPIRTRFVSREEMVGESA